MGTRQELMDAYYGLRNSEEWGALKPEEQTALHDGMVKTYDFITQVEAERGVPGANRVGYVPGYLDRGTEKVTRELDELILPKSDSTISRMQRVFKPGTETDILPPGTITGIGPVTTGERVSRVGEKLAVDAAKNVPWLIPGVQQAMALDMALSAMNQVQEAKTAEEKSAAQKNAALAGVAFVPIIGPLALGVNGAMSIREKAAKLQEDYPELSGPEVMQTLFEDDPWEFVGSAVFAAHSGVGAVRRATREGVSPDTRLKKADLSQEIAGQVRTTGKLPVSPMPVSPPEAKAPLPVSPPGVKAPLPVSPPEAKAPLSSFPPEGLERAIPMAREQVKFGPQVLSEFPAKLPPQLEIDRAVSELEKFQGDRLQQVKEALRPHLNTVGYQDYAQSVLDTEAQRSEAEKNFFLIQIQEAANRNDPDPIAAAKAVTAIRGLDHSVWGKYQAPQERVPVSTPVSTPVAFPAPVTPKPQAAIEQQRVETEIIKNAQRANIEPQGQNVPMLNKNVEGIRQASEVAPEQNLSVVFTGKTSPSLETNTETEALPASLSSLDSALPPLPPVESKISSVAQAVDGMGFDTFTKEYAANPERFTAELPPSLAKNITPIGVYRELIVQAKREQDKAGEPADLSQTEPLPKSNTGIDLEPAPDEQLGLVDLITQNLSDWKKNLGKKETAFPLSVRVAPHTVLERTRLTAVERLLAYYTNARESLDKIQTMIETNPPDARNPVKAADLRISKTEVALERERLNTIIAFQQSIIDEKQPWDEVEQNILFHSALERNPDLQKKYKRDSGVSNKEALEGIEHFRKQGNLDALERIRTKFITITTADIQHRLSYDMLSKKEAARLIARAKAGYASMKGVPENIAFELPSAATQTKQGRGLSVGGDEFIQAKGRWSRPTDVIGHTIDQLNKGIIRGEENLVAQKLYKLFLSSAVRFEGMIKIDPKPADIKPHHAVVSAKFNGKTRNTLIKDPDLAIAIKGMRGMELNFALQQMTKMNQIRQALATQYRLTFSIFNLPRDVGSAGFHMFVRQGPLFALKVLSNIPHSLRAVENQLLSGNVDPVYQKFIDAGSRTGWYQSRRPEEIQVMMADEVKTAVDWAQGVVNRGTIKTAVLAVPRKFGSLISRFGQITEDAVRLSVFDIGIKNKMSDSDAALLSRTMIDFNKGGEARAYIAALYMFANAQFAGTRALYNTIRTNPKRAAIAISALVATGFIADQWTAANQATANPSQPTAYDDEKEWKKSTTIPLYLPGVGITYLPMAPGLTVFTNAGRHLSAWMRGAMTSKQVAKNTALSLIAGFSPLGEANLLMAVIPSIVRPILEVSKGETWYGTPMATPQIPFQAPRPRSELSRRGDSALSTILAKGVNWLGGGSKFKQGEIPGSPTPSELDYLFDAYTSGNPKDWQQFYHLGMNLLSGTLTPIGETPILRRLAGSDPHYSITEKFHDYGDILEIYRKEHHAGVADPKEHWKLRLGFRYETFQADVSKWHKEAEKFRDAGNDKAARVLESKIDARKDQFNKIYQRKGA